MRLVASLLLSAFAAVDGQNVNPNPMDSIRKLPGYRPTHDTVQLLTAGRIAKYAPKLQHAWTVYLDRSREQYTRDTAAMGRELRAAGLHAMTRGPYSHDFSVKPEMTPAWFATDSAQRMAAIILSFQAPNGGWSKHVDFAKHLRQPGESYFAESADWEWISTIDNDQTTEQIHFLALTDRAHRDARYERAVVQGIDYLLESQYPNGCFPQVYPLEGSYHDAVSFNDNATVNVLDVLREDSLGAFPYSPSAQRSRAARGVAKGIECILDSQVRIGGKLTGWGQQHDPLTLEPTSARSYELTSLAGQETAAIVDLLMTISSPTTRVIDAVYGATEWLAAVPLYGFSYENYELQKRYGAGPLWGRLYEIGTNRVIMANRDGIKLYDWDKLTDRRSGYGWYTTKPAATLAAFKRWAETHRRTP
ncbi:MAG TPA: pectate lyase [Gemmatimonadaceae bacterium]|nr:pectate lyase [Gemmatimonadaceae bacterium]